MICREGFCVCGVSAAGCWFGRRLAKERSALVHSVGRYAPVRLRAWTLRDSGRVPLTPQKNAKGGELRTQLAALRQVSPALQRILPRAKRNQIPVFMHSCPEALRLAGARSAPLLRSARKRAEKFGCYVRLRGLVDEEGDFMADVFDAV